MHLNHCSNRIAWGSLDFIVALFTEKLSFKVLRRTPSAVWMRQAGANVDIQFKETKAVPTGSDKHNSHVAFISDAPEKEIEALSRWVEEKGHSTRIGSWSDREFYLDIPSIFIDFAIEIMGAELARYDENE